MSKSPVKKANPAGISGDNGQTRTKKGGKARQKIKDAALHLMTVQSYHELRVVDITREAGVATGLFYHYFESLPQLASEVMHDFVGELQKSENIEQDIEKGDWYGRIYAYNQLVVDAYSAKPGLMRSLFQLADDNAEFSQMLRNNFVQQLMWLVDLMPHLFPDTSFSEHQRLMLIYTLAASSEVLLRDYFVDKIEKLASEPVSAEQLSELLSVMFYRGLFLQNPPREKLKHYRDIENMHKP